MSIIVSNCQQCDEQQFQPLSCVHYTIFSVVKLDLFIRALLLDRILALEKTTRTPRVHLVSYRNQYFKTFLRQLQQKGIVFHSVLLGECPQASCSKRADTIYYIIISI